LSVFTAIAVFAVVYVTGASANLAGSSFESNDGNLVVNTAGNHDWVNAPNLSVGIDKPTGTQDNSFGQGAKEDNINTTVVSGSIPNSKADLARFALAGEVIGTDTYMYLAWSRENQSGTVNFDFELNKLAQPDLTTPGPKVLNRSINDVLINYAFQGGSNTPTLTKYHWNGSSWTNDGVISSSCSEGLTNGVTVSENLGGNIAVNRPAQQFGEAGINLTCAGIVQSGACESFGSGYVKSRSSTAFTSEIKDFIAPVSLHFSNCGKLTIKKHTSPRGLDQSFGYSTTGGLLASPGTFSLNDTGNTTSDSAANTKVFDNLQPNSYTVTEDADPTGFAFDSVSCTGTGAAADASVSGRVVTADIHAGDDITCTYVNNQQLGSIKVSKSSIKGQALSGATFSVTGPGGYSATLTSGADGTDCVSGLVFGSYTVTETAAPDGYSIDDTSGHLVTVGTNDTCATHSTVDFPATDTPLTDLTVEAKSQATGGTDSQITCLDSSNANVGDSPSGNVEDATVSAPDLSPGTYICTVVIDP